jgi:hypothetical protein
VTALAEYVYISDTKLREFIPRDRGWWLRGRVRNVRAEIGAGPAKAGVDIDLDTDRLISEGLRVSRVLQMGKAERHVSRVATSADDPGLLPGDWIFFDGRIGCHLVDIEPRPGAVLFCQVPSARRRSVLLHGSAIHLMDRRQPGEPAAAVPIAFSAQGEVPRIMREATANTADAFGRVWHALKEREAGPVSGLAADLADFYAFVVKTDWFLASAPFLAGFALVTAIVALPDGTEVLMGSPLFVRRARPE